MSSLASSATCSPRSQAVHRFGGFAQLSKLTGLQSHRRPRAYWHDMDNVVREMLAFVREEAQLGAGSARSTADPTTEGSDGRPRLSSSQIEACGSDASSEKHIERLFDRMPTQSTLIAAGRKDLLYAVQMHGHNRVAAR